MVKDEETMAQLEKWQSGEELPRAKPPHHGMPGYTDDEPSYEEAEQTYSSDKSNDTSDEDDAAEFEMTRQAGRTTL